MPKRAIKFNLDFAKKDILSKFEIKQFDNAILEISTFMDSLSYTITEDTNIKLYVCISNDVFKQESNINIQENKIIIDLDKNIIAKKGKALAELELSDVTGVTTSTTFIFDVEGKVGEGSAIPGGAEGLIAKYQRLLKEFKQEQQLQLDDINKTLESHTEQLNNHKSQLAQIENKNIEQDTRLKQVENKNKVQDVYINGLFNENKDGRLSVEGEGNDLKLEGSKQGLVEVERVVGNTFVNLYKNLTKIFNTHYVYGYNEKIDISLFKPSVQYTTIVLGCERVYLTSICNSSSTQSFYIKQLGNKHCFTTPSDLSIFTEDLRVYCYPTDSNLFVEGDEEKIKVLILEGDYTNKPIPSESFEGLQSSFEENLVTQEMVAQGLEDAENLGKYKVPTKIVGKNKFKGIVLKDTSVSNSTGLTYSDTGTTIIEFKEFNYNVNYILSGNNLNRRTVYKYDKNNNYLGYEDLSDNKFIINDKSIHKLLIKIGYYLNNSSIVSDIQLEEGMVATDYEPYFERTANAYLNSPLLEGDEIVWEKDGLYHYHYRNSEILDGSEDEKWGINHEMTNCIAFACNNTKVKKNCIFLMDKFKYNGTNHLVDEDGFFNAPYSTIYITISKSKLSTQDVVGFVSWLKSNPVTVVYELAEPYYEPISTDKLLLECANDSTLHIDTVVPVESVSASYTTGIPNAYLLQETNNNQDNLIDISLCATDEMYMMIEPLLEAIPQTINERMVSKMVDMYVAMIIRELKDIEEVPARYRKEVQEILDKLEK